MKRHTRSLLHAGFTMVELLVGIAIIATLAGIAVLGTRTALRAANASKCTSNLKDIGTILQSMATEGIDTDSHNANTFPAYKGSLNDDDQTDFIWWDLVAEASGAAKRKSGDWDYETIPKETNLQNPLSRFELGGKDDEFFGWGNSVNTRGGYAYNAKLGGDLSGGDDTLSSIVATANLEDASITIWIAESDDELTRPGYYFDEVTNAPQGNYKDGAHCYFADNHVAHIKNVHLKNPQKFDFLTDIRDKNFDHQP